MVLKWLFNAFLFLWLYHAVVRPLFMGYFYGNAPKRNSENSAKTRTNMPNQAPRGPARVHKTMDDGEYIDYEEVKK
jgi:hypothetical protein